MKRSTFLRKTQQDRKPLIAFLNKLDKIVPEDFQAVVADADQKTWEDTHCLSCANCCSKMTPTFTPADLKRIAKHLGMTVAAFKEQWTYTDDNNDVVNKTTPCQFLNKDNTCSIYEVRPLDCAEFPHHSKRPFDAFNDTFITNLSYCPATFELVRRLKKHVEQHYVW